MEEFIINHAQFAHWIVFGLFMLAGLNLPISEDLLIIVSGILASTVIPENTWKLFTAVFLGAYLSDVFVYVVGRFLGPNLGKIKWFSKMIHPERLEKITNYYQKYGPWTLMIGRFIPFGVRNCLFVTAGIGGMGVWKFLVFDGMACLLSNSVLFTASYFFGKNVSSIVHSVNIVVFGFFLVAIIGFFCYKKIRVKTKC